MEHTFDMGYWDQIWSSDRATAMNLSAPNPHLQIQVQDLSPGSAIDAGCGAGTEAIWLASQGWTVTAADIARAALEFGRERADAAGLADRIEWVQADLSTWQPPANYDLVTTHYAHPSIPQLEFYKRIATWVAPGGTLLIVGHLHPDKFDKLDKFGHAHPHNHDHRVTNHREHTHPPAEASATAVTITALLDPTSWHVVTAEESQRTMTDSSGLEKTLHDVVIHATRLS